MEIAQRQEIGGEKEIISREFEIITNPEDWIKWCDAVGDFNPVHRNPEVARMYGLEDVIAPMMYLASFSQGKSDNERFEIRWGRNKSRQVVYPGDKVRLIQTNGVISYFKGDDEVLVIGSKGEIPPSRENTDVVHRFTTEVLPGRVLSFLDSLAMETDFREIPIFYVASLAGSALLDLKKQADGECAGIHIYQSFAVYQKPNFGKMNVLIRQKRIKHGFRIFDMYWLQGEHLAGIGVAKVR